MLHAGLIVKDVKEDGEVKKYVVEHPNGNSINGLISKKLKEKFVKCLFSNCDLKIEVGAFDEHLKSVHSSSFWQTYKGYVPIKICLGTVDYDS